MGLSLPATNLHGGGVSARLPQPPQHPPRVCCLASPSEPGLCQRCALPAHIPLTNDWNEPMAGNLLPEDK